MKTALGKTGRLLALVLWALVWPAGAGGAFQPEPASKPAPEDWEVALAVVRQVALNPTETPERRANAIMAYAKLQMFRGQTDPAIGTCKEVFGAANDHKVAEAAVRAACMVVRQSRGNLGAASELIAAWKAGAPGPFRNALDAVNLDLAKISQYLMDMAARRLAPDPMPVGAPYWMPGRGGGGAINFSAPVAAAPPWTAIQPSAGPPMLRVDLPAIAPAAWTAKDGAIGYCPIFRITLPVYAPPEWYGRFQFPPLPPEPPKPPAPPAK